jgi:hypothetical protein
MCPFTCIFSGAGARNRTADLCITSAFSVVYTVLRVRRLGPDQGVSSTKSCGSTRVDLILKGFPTQANAAAWHILPRSYPQVLCRASHQADWLFEESWLA